MGTSGVYTSLEKVIEPGEVKTTCPSVAHMSSGMQGFVEARLL